MEAVVREQERAELLAEADPLPRHGLAWVPYLWSRVFFPGEDPNPEPIRLRSLALLIFLPALLLYGSLSFHLFEPDEGRYAEIPREMLNRGEWVVPLLQSEPYLDKPPLLYWLVRLSYSVFGVHDWSARLVPAFALHACILITYLFGRRWLGERAAFWGALLLSIAPGFITIGRFLTMDSLLTLLVSLSVFAGYQTLRANRFKLAWLCLSAIACGLGVLAKGPVAIVLLIPPICLYAWLAGTKLGLSRRAILLFGAIVLAVALPWYVAICVRLPAFAYHFLWEHNVVRFLAPFDHLRPIWFYMPILLIGLLPATLLALPFARFLFSANDSSLRTPSLGFVLLAGAWCVLFFSLSGCKLPTYILPAFPILALALGTFIARSGWADSVWTKRIAAAGFVMVFAGHNIAIPWYAGYRGPLACGPEVTAYCRGGETPVVSYPRNCDSVSFYTERDDLRNFRSKETHLLVQDMLKRPRTVVLFTHRHSLQGLRFALPAELRIVDVKHLGLGDLPGVPANIMSRLSWLMGETSLGLCDVAVVERQSPAQTSTPNPSLITQFTNPLEDGEHR
jgi:hypothetical protein